MGKERNHNKLTTGFEWEIVILDKHGTPVKDKDISGITAHLRNKVPSSRTASDWLPCLNRTLLELRSGICYNKKELERKTRNMIGELVEYLKGNNLLMIPAGSYFPSGGAAGLHIHTGSWKYTEGLQKPVNSMSRYMPCFGALAVNSPLWGNNPLNSPLKFKSYRIKHNAQQMSVPGYVEPSLSHLTWGNDITVKFISHPTIEVRICDAPLSWKLADEITVLISSFINESLKDIPEFRKENFEESVDNRIRAMRDGLQAVFLWNKKERPVVDIIEEIIEIAIPSLKIMGYTELPIIKKMLELKQTQADFIKFLYENYSGDIYDFYIYLASAIKWHDDAFLEYLDFAPSLTTLPLMDINEYLLSLIGNRTKYSSLYSSLQQPTPLFEKRIKNIIDRGLIKCTFDLEEGLLLSRK